MPVIQQTNNDDLNGMIRFRVSPLWEFLVSLDAAAHTWQFESWTKAMKSALSEETLTQESPLAPVENKDFYELAIDAPDHNSIESFLEYVRSLSIEDFIFYSLGRLIPREKIRLPMTPQFFRSEMEECCNENGGFISLYADHYKWLNDPEKKREEVLSFWSTYYRDFYIHNIKDFSEEYNKKFREWQQLMEQEGGRALYKYVRTTDWFPSPLPPGQEYNSIEIIPVHFLPQRQRTYFGYGRIVILSPSLHTPELMQSMQELKNDLVVLLKALGDDSRLEILRIIVESEYDMNGKSLAHKLSISPSVVSRHLKQLKNAGIILEKTEDNRNFYYGINKDSVLQINRKLLYYLTEKKD